MDAVRGYLEMGGYAGFVWPALGLTAAVMLGLLVHSLRLARSREQRLQAELGAARGGRREGGR